MFYNLSANVFALTLRNIVPAELRSNNDQSSGGEYHQTIGIVSTASHYPVLSDNGHHNVALQMISSITYPSYGYMLNNSNGIRSVPDRL